MEEALSPCRLFPQVRSTPHACLFLPPEIAALLLFHRGCLRLGNGLHVWLGLCLTQTHECILLGPECCIQVHLSHAISIPGKIHATIIVAYAAAAVGGRIGVPNLSSSTQVWTCHLVTFHLKP